MPAGDEAVIVDDADVEPTGDDATEADAPMELLMEEPDAMEEEAEEVAEAEIPTFLLEKNTSVKMNLNDQQQVVTAENVEIKSCLSANAWVVSVDKTGLLTAVGEGIARVTFTVTGNKWLVLTVTVVDPTKPTGVSFEEGKAITIDIAAGEPVQLNAVMTSDTAESDFTFKSSNARVATVDENGVVTPVSEGTTYITVTIVCGKKTAMLTLKVVDPYKPVSVKYEQGKSGTAYLGTEYPLTAVLTPDTAITDLKWKSSNARVAKVDATGLVTPLTEGTATITVTTVKGSKTATITVKVVAPYKPTAIELLDGAAIELGLNEIYPLDYRLVPDTAESGVTWKTSNAKVATVNAFGEVTAHAEGTATITATTAKSGRTDSIKVTVIDPTKPSRIELYDRDENLLKGTVNLPVACDNTIEVRVLPEEALDSHSYTISCSNTAIVGLEAQNEYFWGKKKGTATITVKADTGLTASFTINVVANKIDNLCAKPATAAVTALNGAWDAWLKSVEFVSEDQVVCEYYFLNGRADTVTKLEDLAAWVNVNGTDVADGEITSITVNAAAKSWKTIKVTLTGNDVIDTNITRARPAAAGVDYGFAYE